MAFGEVLARYDQFAVLAVLLVIVTTALRAILFETADARHALRWVALSLLSVATLYASAWANPVARAIRRQAQNFDELPESSPLRAEFARLHARSRRAMSVSVLLGLVALFLS